VPAKRGGSGKTIQCSTRHGDNMRGTGDVPRIAGLQPVCIARQLICVQNGSSAVVAVAPTKNVVTNLLEDAIIAISAYLGSVPSE
jgi:cytochrome c553